MFRRTAFWFLTFILSVWAGYQLAWHPELREGLMANSVQSVGSLILAVAAIGVLVWAFRNPSGWKMLLAFVLGVTSALWGASLFMVFAGGRFVLLLVVLIVLAALWALTILHDREELRSMRRRPKLSGLKNRFHFSFRSKGYRAYLAQQKANKPSDPNDSGLGVVSSSAPAAG